jgi:hypothetical protein
MNSRKNGLNDISLQTPLEGELGVLTVLDKRDVEHFQLRAEAAGYDRLVTHLIEPSQDRPALGYVSAHRIGEAWSTWGYGRFDKVVLAWNAMNGENVGVFVSMLEALECTLVGTESFLLKMPGNEQ